MLDSARNLLTFDHAQGIYPSETASPSAPMRLFSPHWPQYRADPPLQRCIARLVSSTISFSTPMFFYPFAAVVGMERAKRSLLLHAVDPRIGGTLLLGQRGCAKSTLVRGFAALLPKPDGVQAPFVDVPLGVSEDRLLGAVHGESLVRTGAWTAQAGLLEKADGGVLYVDEINLLPDALSDLLLDSAASGMHRQERDGLSQVLHSRYILIGTMNPEEGDLRPQLSDRFAHGVRIEDSFSALERVEIGRRRLAFDDDPVAFEKEWAPSTELLNARLLEARTRLLGVQVPDALRLELAQRAHQAGLEGMRAELAVLRTARAAAAFRGAAAASAEDVEEAWLLCLGHRCSPSQEPQPPAQRPTQERPPSEKANPGSYSTASPQRPQPLTPKDAQPVPIPLLPMQKPRILSLPQPLFPNRHLTAPMAATSRLATSRLEGGPVLWQASVVASLKRGWTPGGAGWTWMRSSAKPLRRLWALVDASRSTGSAAFLEQAREFVAGLLPLATKVSLLLIHNNKIEWMFRNVAPQGALARLASLPSAAGASPIAGAIGKLHRAVSAGRPTRYDTVCLCSDGMPTLRAGQSAGQAAREIRVAIQRLGCSLPKAPVWLLPEMGRGVAAWVGRLLRGSGCQLLQPPLR